LLGGGALGSAQAAAYLGIVLSQYVNILSRRTSRSFFGRHLFSNPQFWLALSLALVAMTVMVTFPAVGIWFGFEPLDLKDWLWPVAGALTMPACFEFRKAFLR
jgi:magnesium-transporting ATPase (P-type)